MNRLTKALMLLFTAVFMIGLTACSNEPTPTPTPTELSVDDTNQYIYEAQKKLKDGRTVTCVIYNSYQEGGINCDWANAK